MRILHGHDEYEDFRQNQQAGSKMKIRQFLRGFLPKPRRRFSLFQIEPTSNCNLNCIMCPWTELHTGKSDMSWGVFEKIAEYFCYSEGVDFTGTGEPLLHPRLEEMVRIAKDRGCVTGFSTNATLLEPERGRALIGAGLDWIAYSVDAATEETYENIRLGGRFYRVLENIEAFRNLRDKSGDTKPKSMLFFVMMKDNMAELPDAVEMAHNLGIEHFVAKNLDVIMKQFDDDRRIFVNSKDDKIDPAVSLLIDKAKIKADKHNLPFRVYDLFPSERPICEQDPLNSLFIARDGSVSPCINLAYIEDRVFCGSWKTFPLQRLGNLMKEPLATIWEKHQYEHFRSLFIGRMHCNTRRFMQFAANGFRGNGPTEELPPPPEGCGGCHYLYGV
jgi:MoaA/NifB/PqqE/SkfB family radical SAM enzyme